MNLIKPGCFFLRKILLAGFVLWLWSSGVSAYDFQVTCDGVDTKGSCGPGASFVMQKISNAHDAIATPLAPSNLQIYLANCTSDTSCVKLVGPFFEKYIGDSSGNGQVSNFGAFATAFENLPWSNKLTGTITSGSNAGGSDVWNANAYRGLCFSVTGVDGKTSGWALWGVNYLYPPGSVQCSAPINRTALDTCSVSTPSIDVTFDQLERSEISTVAGTKTDITKTFNINCSGNTGHNFSLKLNMTPVSWSTSQIATSNPALGVSITKSGALLNAGDTFTMSVPAGGISENADLIFSVLRNPSVPVSSIATGDFTASATLIVTEL